jgi:amino acid transporter
MSQAEIKTDKTPTESGERALHSGRLGVIGVVFFVVAAAAPLVGMTGAVPIAIGLGNGSGVPGAYVAVGITLVLFSVGYAAMSQRVTNTGAFFAYVGRGLGSAAGVGSAFVSLVAYLTVQLAIYGYFGGIAETTFGEKAHINLAWYWWAIIAWVVVSVLALFSVDIGAKVLGVFMSLEVLSLVIMAIAVFVQGGPHGFHFGDSFGPSKVFTGGLAGTAGIALAFAFASFIGFEATAIYGEESKNPKRTVPLATYSAITLITVLFGVVSLSIVTALGSNNVVDQTMTLSQSDPNDPSTALTNPANVVFHVAKTDIGGWLGSWAGTLVENTMQWLVITSLFAGLLAFQNAASRYFFSMGRARVLPRQLARTNKFGAPAVASGVTTAIAFIVILIFALTHQDPIVNLFSWFSGVTALAMVLVEALVCIAIIAYFRKVNDDKRLWHTVIAPILAFIGLMLGEYLLMSRFGLMAGTAPAGVDPTTHSWALNATGWVLVLLPFVVLVLGFLYGFLIRSRENEDAVKDLVT